MSSTIAKKTSVLIEKIAYENEEIGQFVWRMEHPIKKIELSYQKNIVHFLLGIKEDIDDKSFLQNNKCDRNFKKWI